VLPPVALAAGLLVTGCGDDGRSAQPGVPRTAAVAPERFDGAAAFELLRRQVEFGPRAPGTPGHQAQLQWMEAFLREHTPDVTLQPFTHVSGRTGQTLRMTNVLARFNADSRQRVLLVAHWDTRPTADEDRDPARRNQPILGANDGASGVAVLLQLATVLSRHSPPIGVDLLLVDGEDWAPGEMFLGSTYFAANLPPGYRPLYGIVVDMVADQNPVFPVEGYSNEYAPEVVARVWRLAAELGYERFFPNRAGPYVMDDHIPLNRAGIRTIDIIDFDYGPGNRFWHTHQDVVENTAPLGLEVVGTVLLELIFRGG
jgi:glutaminyl-peptide cyclotransferase